MSNINSAAPHTSMISAVAAGVLLTLALLSVLFLLQENGMILPTGAAQQLHELTHDARHAVGVPCH